eukprot:c5760_g1_i1.p1 GENE.c5760_g1_i1~~c5760_g1_i1.p1  ORF type:complete len:383 (-),score=100.57 c5760_g1_i1:189-1337(-)
MFGGRRQLCVFVLMLALVCDAQLAATNNAQTIGQMQMQMQMLPQMQSQYQQQQQQQFAPASFVQRLNNNRYMQQLAPATKQGALAPVLLGLRSEAASGDASNPAPRIFFSSGATELTHSFYLMNSCVKGTGTTSVAVKCEVSHRVSLYIYPTSDECAGTFDHVEQWIVPGPVLIPSTSTTKFYVTCDGSQIGSKSSSQVKLFSDSACATPAVMALNGRLSTCMSASTSGEGVFQLVSTGASPTRTTYKDAECHTAIAKDSKALTECTPVSGTLWYKAAASVAASEESSSESGWYLASRVLFGIFGGTAWLFIMWLVGCMIFAFFYNLYASFANGLVRKQVILNAHRADATLVHTRTHVPEHEVHHNELFAGQFGGDRQVDIL